MQNSRSPAEREPVRSGLPATNRWGIPAELPDSRGTSHEIKPFRPAGVEHTPTRGAVSSHEAPVTESERGVMTEPLN